LYRYSRSGFLLAVLLVPALVGCSGGKKTSSEPTDQAKVPGGTAVVAFAAEPDVLNPLIFKSAYSGQILVLSIDSLMEMGEDFRYFPQVAKSVSLSQDSLMVTVALREWRWEDGSLVTADDVVRSVELFMDPRIASPRAGGRLANVARVEALASDTVRYHFRERRADQIATLGHYLLPAAAVAHLDPAEVMSWPMNEAPVSNGMFRVSSWEHDRHLLLERNMSYSGSPPHLDRLLLRIIPDEMTRFVELETGGVDVMTDVPPHLAVRLEARDDFSIARTSGRLIGMVYWNHDKVLFGERKVRKALSFAMDRRAIVDGLLGGYGQIAAGPFPPVVWAHDPTVEPDPFDPGKARALLDDSGWSDTDNDGIRDREGVPFAFTMITRKGDPVRENAIIILRENLQAVGIEMTIRILEFTTAIDRVRAGEFDAYLGVFSAQLSVDPAALLGSDGFDRYNYGRYANASADSLMDLGMRITNRNDAQPVWSSFQRLMAEEQPMAFLYHPDMLIAYNNRIRDIQPHVLSPFQNIRDWWIAPEDRKY